MPFDFPGKLVVTLWHGLEPTHTGTFHTIHTGERSDFRSLVRRCFDACYSVGAPTAVLHSPHGTVMSTFRELMTYVALWKRMTRNRIVDRGGQHEPPPLVCVSHGWSFDANRLPTKLLGVRKELISFCEREGDVATRQMIQPSPGVRQRPVTAASRPTASPPRGQSATAKRPGTAGHRSPLRSGVADEPQSSPPPEIESIYRPTVLLESQLDPAGFEVVVPHRASSRQRPASANLLLGDRLKAKNAVHNPKSVFGSTTAASTLYQIQHSQKFRARFPSDGSLSMTLRSNATVSPTPSTEDMEADFGTAQLPQAAVHRASPRQQQCNSISSTPKSGSTPEGQPSVGQRRSITVRVLGQPPRRKSISPQTLPESSVLGSPQIASLPSPVHATQAKNITRSMVFVPVGSISSAISPSNSSPSMSSRRPTSASLIPRTANLGLPVGVILNYLGEKVQLDGGIIAPDEIVCSVQGGQLWKVECVTPKSAHCRKVWRSVDPRISKFVAAEASELFAGFTNRKRATLPPSLSFLTDECADIPLATLRRTGAFPFILWARIHWNSDRTSVSGLSIESCSQHQRQWKDAMNMCPACRKVIPEAVVHSDSIFEDDEDAPTDSGGFLQTWTSETGGEPPKVHPPAVL